MTRFPPYIVFVAMALLLTGCQEKIHTVAEFKQDSGLRTVFQKKCNGGELATSDENCSNVNLAARQIAEEGERPTNTASWSALANKIGKQQP